IHRITRDHSVVEDLIVQGEITPEEARQHPQRNLITRALGSERQVQADLYEERLAEGEVILLCTDGLSNVVTEQEILYELVYGGPIETCCQRLLDITISRGAPDNVTVVLFQV
ncbi:MAG: serine/threonine-protein phosphatase, partial [Clostridiales bacterium]|nr:serine/threonine-protein phosphatase [Clostridiales bacterium]